MCFLFSRNALLTGGKHFADNVSGTGTLKILTEEFSKVSVIIIFLK